MVDHSERLSTAAKRFIAPDRPTLEIAPYFSPFLSKAGYRVDYTDRLGTGDLRRRASENPEQAGAPILEIDFVWSPGKRLGDCAVAHRRYDAVVASHVMEHIANPVGWLNEILEVTNIGGYVVLIIPDRRYTADFFRRETDFAQLVQWWIEQPASPTTGQVLDFMSYSFAKLHAMETVRCEAGAPLNTARAYTDTEALDMGVFVHNERQYMDIHCTVWNAETCGEIFGRLSALGMIGAEVVDVVADEGEFALVLRKTGEPKLRPPGQKVAPRLDSIDHQIGVMRHDLSFLIQFVAARLPKDELAGAEYLPQKQ